MGEYYGNAGDVGSVYFGPNHPMKPHRLCMTHHLVLSYDLHKKMEIYVSKILRQIVYLLFIIRDYLFWFNYLLLFFPSKMQRPHKAYPVELAQFHSADYVEFLHRITPDTQHLFMNDLAKCMVVLKNILFCFVFSSFFFV